MRRKIFGIVISVVAMIALGTSPVFATAPCAVETFTNLPPNTIVTNATLWTAGQSVEGVTAGATFCQVEVTNKMPYEKVAGDSDIYSEVWLPLAWNGRYLGLGNGGSAPGFQWATLNAGITAGYATANTTMGTHENMPALPLGGALDFSFGVGYPQRVINFGYLATHLMTLSAKDIINTFYGTSPAYSYFTGCSTGGQQSMSEAQRYPEDYDGIVEGSGAFNRVPTHEKMIWMYQINQFRNPPMDFTRVEDHYITPGTIVPGVSADFGKWALITKAVVAACDGLDGVLDGIIDDPRQCKFDANTLLCPSGTNSPTCLTPGEVFAINQLWKGAFDPKTGQRILVGMTKGSESDPSIYGPITGIYFYPLAYEGPKPPLAPTPLKGELINWAPSLENFDLQYFDWDHDAAIADYELAPILNATNPDLSKFKARGGKLIMYHGWADPLVFSLESPHYYENVLETMGGLNKVKQFARLFMVPGMGHCGLGGPFPAVFADSLGGNYITNGLGSLVNWVEKGEAPDLIVAVNPFIPAPGMTRPLCPYPEVARYSGSGSTNAAANFLCVPPVTIRIEPETINLKSKGEITAFITVPAGFDVRDWGISNLECQGAPMTRGSVSGDGLTYIAKFNTQDLMNVAAGDKVTFKVQGLFNKGGEQAMLLGFDTVKVIK
ncbi:MAG: tannase/feruloyl esterase family alpha/beta hydrolase [Syntrophales bacterium]